MVMACTAALLIAEGTVKGPPFQIQVVRMERIEPRCPPAIQRRPTAWVT